jgi:capsular polysaccharide biosynthesis protein
MKRFARCVLILILVTVLGGVCGYFYEDSTLTPMYTSTAQLYVVPGEANEATVRAADGGLKDDFVIIFKSSVVISEAQKIAGTSEDIAQYLTVTSPANSNIVEITCTNPDQNTAKTYVDAVAKTALKTTSIIPVSSIQILSEGTSTNERVKPDLYRNTVMIAAGCAGICFVIELIVVLILCAFKKPVDDSDDESEYERYYGRTTMALENRNDEHYHHHHSHEDDVTHERHAQTGSYSKEEPGDMQDILEDFDEDYAEDEDYADENDTAEEVSSEQPDSESEQSPEEEHYTEEDSNQEEPVEESDVEENVSPEAVIEEEIVDDEAAVSREENEASVSENANESFDSDADIDAAFEEQVITKEQQEEAEDENPVEEDEEEAFEETEEEAFEGPQILQSSARILGIIKK